MLDRKATGIKQVREAIKQVRGEVDGAPVWKKDKVPQLQPLKALSGAYEGAGEAGNEGSNISEGQKAC